MCLVSVCLLHGGVVAAQADSVVTVFVEKGASKLVVEEGMPWKRGQGFLECAGLNNYLRAGKGLGAGDFHIRARLSLANLAHTAASFVIDDRHHFGFDGPARKMFVEGRLFGRQTITLDDTVGLIQPGVPFQFEVIRKGQEMAFLVDGKVIYKTRYTGDQLRTFAFRPWRSTMRVEEFAATGQTAPLPPPRTQPTKYSIPTIDLSKEKSRQVIVERLPGQYLGHPTTVLLRDNKTILCTYPLGHGGPAAVLKKSTDGGLTWSERLPVPDNWKTAKNCPCIHRLTGPDGVERLFVLEGNGEMRQSVSLDNGQTWTPLEPNGLHCVVAPITIVPIAGGRHLAMYHRGPGDKDRPGLTIWQSISADGGLTWGPERKIAEREWSDPCEPAVIRSPDGKQLAAVMRENSRRYNSLLAVSNDEGQTWSPLVELPESLTGDRHMPRYAHDGRLVIPFRDTAQGSPTKGDFVAWVGTYDDIVNLREARKNSPRDDGDIDMVLKRSLDRGQMWQPMQVIWDDGENTIGNPAPVVDRDTGAIWLPFCRNNDRVFVTKSEDDGATWSTPVEITTDVKPAGWTWYATGPVHGIQLSSGRLLIPCNHKEADGFHSHVIYSDDHGATWKLGGSLGPHMDESVAVEAADGSIYLNARNDRRANRRVYAWSKDGGLTWSDVKPDDTLIEPTCQATAVRFTDEKTHGKSRVLFSNPASVTRDMMTVRVSYDECKTWNAGKLLWKGPSAYSDLCVLPDLTIAALYERGSQRAYEKITFAQFCPEWLTDDLDRMQ